MHAREQEKIQRRPNLWGQPSNRHIADYISLSLPGVVAIRITSVMFLSIISYATTEPDYILPSFKGSKVRIL